MRKKPTYDLDWVYSHTPFKKILEETCDLKIEKSKIQNPEAPGLDTSWHHYMIRFNFPRFKERFEEIKKQLLNTNLCRNNKEYFDWINELGCSTSEVCHVIIDGCIANASGFFEWDWCDDKTNISWGKKV